jgi:dUTP pyrophosphatase
MKEVKIKIVNKSPHPLPSYETAGSAGMDLRAWLEKPFELKPLQRELFHTGLYIELPEGFETQIRPRSGLALKQGLTVLNSPGTIDSDYRGEIMVVLINLSQNPVIIEDGQRIAQMVISKHEKAIWEKVEILNETKRGQGGYGHTG